MLVLYLFCLKRWTIIAYTKKQSVILNVEQIKRTDMTAKFPVAIYDNHASGFTILLTKSTKSWSYFATTTTTKIASVKMHNVSKHED